MDLYCRAFDLLPGQINDKIAIGSVYSLDCAYGSHSCHLVGTIRAIEISDEGGLELYISNPTMGGDEIFSLIWNETDGWRAQVSSPGITAKLLAVKLKLWV